VYRYNILRYDTLLPVTLICIYLYGWSGYFLVNNLKKIQKTAYMILVLAIAIIYSNADVLRWNDNLCEKETLKKIANSTETIIPLKYECNVLSWRQISTPEESRLNGELLMLWNITTVQKQYYHLPE
jgi:hypothetical protein